MVLVRPIQNIYKILQGREQFPGNGLKKGITLLPDNSKVAKSFHLICVLKDFARNRLRLPYEEKRLWTRKIVSHGKSSSTVGIIFTPDLSMRLKVVWEGNQIPSFSFLPSLDFYTSPGKYETKKSFWNVDRYNKLCRLWTYSMQFDLYSFSFRWSIVYPRTVSYHCKIPLRLLFS